MRTVGRTREIAPRRSPINSHSWAYGSLWSARSSAALHDQSPRVNKPTSGTRFRFTHPFLNHRGDQEVRDSCASLASTEKDEPLLGQGRFVTRKAELIPARATAAVP